MTPSRWRSSSWTPQKQPPARMAVSVLSLIVFSLLRSSVSVVGLPVETGIALPECERVGVGAWLEEGDLQGPLAGRIVLAHELVHAALAENAVAGLVDVDTV